METYELTKTEADLLWLLFKQRNDRPDETRTVEDNLLEVLSKEITILTILLRKLYKISEDRIPEKSELMDCLIESKYSKEVDNDTLESLFYMFKYT